MKKILLPAVMVLISATSFAQDTETKKVNASVGLELAAPVGHLSYNWKFGIGFSAQVEYKIIPQVRLTINAGYISYSGKGNGGYKAPTLGQIPLLAGARYYFLENIYLSGQLGVSVFTAKNSDSESAFTYAPGIGVKVGALDMTLKYLAATKRGTTNANVGLRAAISF